MSINPSSKRHKPFPLSMLGVGCSVFDVSLFSLTSLSISHSNFIYHASTLNQSLGHPLSYTPFS